MMSTETPANPGSRDRRDRHLIVPPELAGTISTSAWNLRPKTSFASRDWAASRCWLPQSSPG